MICATQKKLSPYCISSDASRRINLYKLWLTVMVIFIHAYAEEVTLSSGNVALDTPDWLSAVQYAISQSICRCAVPGFFLLSSVLLYRKAFSWTENLKKKVRTLLIPYVLFNSFWIAFFFIFQQVPFLSDYFSKPANIVANWGILDWLRAYGIAKVSPFLYPLWFLKYLFILNIFASAIKYVIVRFPCFSAFVLLAVWLLGSNAYIIQSICFWGFGCYLCAKGITLDDSQHSRKVPLTFVYFLLVALDTATRELPFNRYISKVGILVGVVFWYVCCTDIKNGKYRDILQQLAAYAFPIYLFHEMNLSVLRKLCVKLLPQTHVIQLLEYFGIPVIIFFCCLILSGFIERFWPGLYAVITGNRNKQQPGVPGGS